MIETIQVSRPQLISSIFDETVPKCSPQWAMKTLKISASKNDLFSKYWNHNGNTQIKIEFDYTNIHILYTSLFFSNNIFLDEIL